MAGKFVITTFATEGPPYDAGADLRGIEREFREIVECYADQYLTFTPRSLVSNDPAFHAYTRDYTAWLEQHPDRHELGVHNIGWAKVGFQMWKPFLLQHVLLADEINEGDVVLYHDINFHKYPSYVLHLDQWRSLSGRILDDLGCDIFIPSSGEKLKKDVKAYLVRKYLGEAYFEETGLWVGLIVMRKSKQSLRFLHEWAAMSEQLDNISFLPNPDSHPEFIWHSPEQAVAAVLAHLWTSNGLFPQDWPGYEVKKRIFSENYLWKADGLNLGKRAKILLGRFGQFLKRAVA